MPIFTICSLLCFKVARSILRLFRESVVGKTDLLETMRKSQSRPDVLGACVPQVVEEEIIDMENVEDVSDLSADDDDIDEL